MTRVFNYTLYGASELRMGGGAEQTQMISYDTSSRLWKRRLCLTIEIPV